MTKRCRLFIEWNDSCLCIFTPSEKFTSEAGSRKFLELTKAWGEASNHGWNSPSRYRMSQAATQKNSRPSPTTVVHLPPQISSIQVKMHWKLPKEDNIIHLLCRWVYNCHRKTTPVVPCGIMETVWPDCTIFFKDLGFKFSYKNSSNILLLFGIVLKMHIKF